MKDVVIIDLELSLGDAAVLDSNGLDWVICLSCKTIVGL